MTHVATVLKRIAFMLALALLIRLVAGCAAVPVEGPIASSVVLLRGGARNCGGVATGPRTIMTAAHCVDDLPRGANAPAEQEIVTAEDWQEHGASVVRRARVLSRDDGRDVAVLQVPDGDELPAWAEIGAVGQLPRVVLIRAREFYWRWTEEATSVGFVGTTVCAGDSGSGLFDGDGKLVGLQLTRFSVTAGDRCSQGGMWRALGPSWGIAP